MLGASDEANVAGNLTAFAIVNAAGFVTGTILGYGVDAVGFRASAESIPNTTCDMEDHITDNTPGNTWAHKFIESYGFYTLLAIAAFLTPGSIMALWGGGIDAIADLSVWVAMALTILSIVYYLVFKFALHRNCCATGNNSVRAALLESVADLSMVVMYVFIGLFIANFIIDILVGAEQFDAWMAASTFAVVLIAAVIGVTPGCGGMIAVAAAFVTIPNFPIAALIAAAIATSGDGIFPLIAQNKKEAIIISSGALIVALIVGYLALLIGI